MTDSSPFTSRTVCLLIAAVAALIAMSVVLNGLGDPESSGGKAGPGAHSISAVGYAGLYETLRRLGWKVKRSDRNPLAESIGGVLVLAEPDINRIDRDLEMKLIRARKILVVLPKWRVEIDDNRSAWISEATPAPLAIPYQIMLLAVREGRVVRRPWPREWESNALNPAPSGDKFVQLLQSTHLTPLVGTDEGMLVGGMELHGRTVWLLADPDVMANHGIGKGDNAAFMISLLASLAGDGAAKGRTPVIFDETIHGLGRNFGSPLQLLFRFPYSVVVVLVLLTAALLAFAGSGRFGGVARPKHRLGFGKERLVDNSARLLEHSDRRAEAARRYLEMIVRRTAAALHAPEKLERHELIQWLDAVGKARKITVSCSDALRRAEQADGEEKERLARLLACAGELYRWRDEMVAAAGETSNGTRAYR